MANVTIDQAALAKIQKKLKTFERFAEEAKAPMQETLLMMKAEMADYPRKSPGAFSRLATPKQRRAYWARVRSGEISHRDGVGYVRTGSLGRKWTTKNRRVAGGREGQLGNNTAYAKYVQQAPGQQSFHLISGWNTDKRMLRETEGKRLRIWKKWIDRQLGR